MAVSAGPFSVWLELESRCNLSCQFCYNAWRPRGEPKPARVGADDFASISTRLLDRLPIDRVALSGGEPLLYPGLDAVLETVARRDVDTILTTNGVLLTRERVQELKKLGLRAVQVPLLAADPEVHDELSRVQCWHRAVDAVASAREAGLEVSVVMVLTRRNVSELPGVIGICRLLGVPRLILNRVHLVGQAVRFRSNLELSALEFTRAVHSARPHLSDDLKLVYGSGAPVDGGPQTCYEGADRDPRRQRINRLAVGPNGDLKFCNEASRGVLNLVSASDAELDEVAGSLVRGDHAPLLESIDICTCRGKLRADTNGVPRTAADPVVAGGFRAWPT